MGKEILDVVQNKDFFYKNLERVGFNGDCSLEILHYDVIAGNVVYPFRVMIRTDESIRGENWKYFFGALDTQRSAYTVDLSCVQQMRDDGVDSGRIVEGFKNFIEDFGYCDDGDSVHTRSKSMYHEHIVRQFQVKTMPLR